jgi:hypothetical protein
MELTMKFVFLSVAIICAPLAGQAWKTNKHIKFGDAYHSTAMHDTDPLTDPELAAAVAKYPLVYVVQNTQRRISVSLTGQNGSTVRWEQGGPTVQWYGFVPRDRQRISLHAYIEDAGQVLLFPSEITLRVYSGGKLLEDKFAEFPRNTKGDLAIAEGIYE